MFIRKSVNFYKESVLSIYAGFDHNPSLEIRGNFLDISKAFDKVWHEDVLYKLESTGISGNLLNLFRCFLNDRCQIVVINSQHPDWAPILAGVPQGSILGLLQFLIYINDLPGNLNSLVKLFADDTSLFSTIHDPALSAKILNDNLSRISGWAPRWEILFNPDMTKQAQEVTFSRQNTKNDHPIVYFNEVPVAHTTCQKHLGMHLDEKLNFNHHVKGKIAKGNKGI